MPNYNVDVKENLLKMGNDHATHNEKTLAEIFDLSGKNAIVTGGTTGMGYAVANRLAEAGASVVIVGRSAVKGENAESEFRARGMEVTYCQADLTEVEECEKVVKFTEEKYGPVDILVNNAARWIFSAYVDTEQWQFDETFNLNVRGVYFMGQFAARSMIENQRVGKIVNIASSSYIANDLANLGLMTTYEASKGAVVSLTMGMAKELKQYGINVNCVAPGSMDTYGNEYPSFGMEDYFDIDGFAEVLSAQTGAGGMPYASPDAPALMVFALCTDLCNWAYGETIKAAGGRHLSHQVIPLSTKIDCLEEPEDYTPPRHIRDKSEGSVSWGVKVFYPDAEE